jgi:hypothetical protein
MAELRAGGETLLERIGRFMAGRLQSETAGYQPFTPSDPETLARTLEPGDVLLIEGNQKISSAIKYLTQSTWSHAAFFVGDELARRGDSALASEERPQLIEVTLGQGCIASPLQKYAAYNTRICRPNGLLATDRQKIIEFMISSIGRQYDLKNIIDMLRYFLPNPPIPVAWRRKMLAFGSGDPTKAICSTLIAEAFGLIRYPILPDLQPHPGHSAASSAFSRQEILHIRHYSLYSPRDFDLSPYFHIVKPTLEYGFDYRKVEWQDETPPDGLTENQARLG